MRNIYSRTAKQKPIFRKKQYNLLAFLVVVIALGSLIWALTQLPSLNRAFANIFPDSLALDYGVVEAEDLPAPASSSSKTQPETSQNEMPSSIELDVPAVMQNPELPTGCESVALTNALSFYGFHLEKTTIADKWLPLSNGDFVYAFLGSPYDRGGNSTMAPCIVNTANSYLETQNTDLRAYDISNLSFEEILTYVGNGQPIVIWNTISQVDPGEPYLTTYENGREYSLFHGSHCVVLSGYDLDKDIVYFSDSLEGNVSCDLDVFAELFYLMGSQAVVIE